ncbi:hypothetical protein [Marinilactibacillus sp. Marseille-P9653]|uniref:hypothetical protein n=1 Tax=Marinilactibacillus sp. Marseille-P9653 TaxID=2866583 RepID=UPI001CE49F97|nr:hypothetical protein [Marinilactibacillus sp. Marseille-P9653]
MRKNKQLLFTKVLYGVFFIATILSLIIVYIDSDSDLLFKFVSAYVFLAFFMVLYIPIVTIKNLKVFKWRDIRKSLVTFIILFLSFSVLNYGFNYMFRPESLDLIKTLSVSFGLSAGIAFFDFTFLKENSTKYKG